MEELERQHGRERPESKANGTSSAQSYTELKDQMKSKCAEGSGSMQENYREQ